MLYNEPFLITHPEIAAEWSEKNAPLTPADFTAGAHDRVWWKGKCGHEWQTAIGNRYISGTGCPYCTTRTTLKGFNDLVTLRPDLAKKWNYERNGELKPEDFRPFSRTKVWWRCNKGHEWQATINDRSKGNGCRICSNKIVVYGYNDLATKRPDFAAEWSDKNLPLTPVKYCGESTPNTGGNVPSAAMNSKRGFPKGYSITAGALFAPASG